MMNALVARARKPTPRIDRAFLGAALALLAALALVGCSAMVPTSRQKASAEQALRPQRAALPPAANIAPYKLGPGDVLQITVFDNPDLSTTAPVGEGGKISFPLLGEVPVNGLTRAQAEHHIAQLLERGKFVRKPYVTIAVTQYGSQSVSVLGDVNKPGAYTIKRPTDVTRVLAMAGGIDAKGSNVVTVVKRGPDGATYRQTIDLARLIEDGNLDQDTFVGNGDIVYVPPAPMFYIYGEVGRPGAYALADGMTVQQALSVGGGLTPRGTVNGIELDRKGPHGRMHHYSAKLDTPLLPDDVLRIPQSWF
jgi:polysaccharide export outer membrane protein